MYAGRIGKITEVGWVQNEPLVGLFVQVDAFGLAKARRNFFSGGVYLCYPDATIDPNGDYYYLEEVKIDFGDDENIIRGDN